MPDDKGKAMATKEGGALTLLPTAYEQVFYYEGKFQSNGLKVIALKELCPLIIDKKKITSQKDLFVIIKSAKTSVYGEIINMLDEMTINDVKRYAIINITKEEEALIK